MQSCLEAAFEPQAWGIFLWALLEWIPSVGLGQGSQETECEKQPWKERGGDKVDRQPQEGLEEKTLEECVRTALPASCLPNLSEIYHTPTSQCEKGSQHC